MYYYCREGTLLGCIYFQLGELLEHKKLIFVFIMQEINSTLIRFIQGREAK